MAIQQSRETQLHQLEWIQPLVFPQQHVAAQVEQAAPVKK
jgi:hypothetical protein